MRKSERRSRRQRRSMNGCFRIFNTSRRGREALAKMVDAETVIGDIVKSGETDDPVEALEKQYHAALVSLGARRTKQAYVIVRQIAQNATNQGLEFNPHDIDFKNTARYLISDRAHELLAQVYFTERDRLRREQS